ncbi:hypothetical protein ANN_04186 [Periplaneta americana]|uniref:Uncharacterized protein n=1 Tax=Periplaneta americana TaxID=6978 RepID=A0ABQ8T9P2_PERAM|nr:hypothetical protein ANN_04186 [Periplaneta americana]
MDGLIGKLNLFEFRGITTEEVKRMSPYSVRSLILVINHLTIRYGIGEDVFEPILDLSNARLQDRVVIAIQVHREGVIGQADITAWTEDRADNTLSPHLLDNRSPLLRHLNMRPAVGCSRLLASHQQAFPEVSDHSNSRRVTYG